MGNLVVYYSVNVGTLIILKCSIKFIYLSPFFQYFSDGFLFDAVLSDVVLVEAV